MQRTISEIRASQSVGRYPICGRIIKFWGRETLPLYEVIYLPGKINLLVRYAA